MVLTRENRKKLQNKADKIELRVWEINIWGTNLEKAVEKPKLIRQAIEIYRELGETIPVFFGR